MRTSVVKPITSEAPPCLPNPCSTNSSNSTCLLSGKACWSNYAIPQYTDLAFEERLALLVDLECTHRHDRRIQRRVRLAGFPQPASIEDLDLSSARGLDRRFVLELAPSATGSPTT